MIINNNNGFLFNPYSKKNLVNLMVKISKLSQIQIENITTNARITVENNYREDKYINQVKYINYSYK